ncbi:MAG TPA: class I tRNA ligase family protein [Polyangiaceae bacterium]|nr:class I tRNA ligase family protein [Polyangiaceae bacterium]
MSAELPFEPVPAELDFPTYERRILELWKERRIFERSELDVPAGARDFVFYEGPPTANGLPHNGHVLTRVVKDLFPRYHSMQGARVLRKGGWDTHGLPVEVEVEKELGIHGKAAIEQYGVKPFVQRCIESVFRYTAEWERLTERIAFWVSLEDAYVTYHRSYVESVWWALSELFNKGLLYQGHKVVWWWAQGGTALSSAEVGLGYKTVDDPSVFVAFPLVDEPETALVVWTTTPWTLPSNTYAAIKPGVTFDVVELGEPLDEKSAEGKPARPLAARRLIVASALRPALEQKLGRKLVVTETRTAEALAGRRYVPPFDVYYSRLGERRVALRGGGEDALYFRVILADFVTLDTGTGIVHVAPAFGEDDHEAHKRELRRYENPDEVELVCAVNPDGRFKPELEKYAGRWVKDADRDIVRELAERSLLVHEELYRHEYPFCWRSENDPLIQLARPGWFIRTTARLDRALENNQAVNWLPEHIKEGRFGDFLRNNVDWALSRERYWGTPLNVWICTQDPEHRHAPTSVDEIESRNPDAFAAFREERRKNPKLNEHLMVHKPWIDEVTFPCPTCGATMRRVSEVVDVWFDSGCMPFAQWGFPHLPGSKERFDAAFPADFISEAIDQTRGWFYSLLMVASLVFDEETQKRLGLSRVRGYPLPFRTCIVLGHVGDREGRKESKSRGNYTPPEIILDRVRMDFAVLEQAFDARAPRGEVWIAREDLEGMDLEEGARLTAYRPGAETRSVELTVRVHKKLPRRVALLSPEDRAELGLGLAPRGLETAPAEVPRLPADARVTLDDPSRPAPGADAFRWFFYASSPPWSNTRHSLTNVRLLQKEFQIKLRNVYSFFTIYANIDGYRPADARFAARPIAERALLDRWLASELELSVRAVRRALDAYLIYDAAQVLIELAESLSNWYVRRSRARFWGPGLEQDKVDAYATLHEALVTIARLVAPFLPFFAEELYQNLVVRAGVPGAKASVHLDTFPTVDESRIDERLSAETRAVRDVVSLGLRARTAQKLKVRQPLARADVVLNDPAWQERLVPYAELMREELNVHELRFMAFSHDEGAVSFRLKPNFRALGPRLGKGVQAVKRALDGANGARLHAELAEHGRVRLDVGGGEAVELGPEEIEVQVEAAPGFAAETGRIGVVVLHTTLTEALVDEGLFREVLSRVQATRKELGLEFTDRVEITLDGTERLVRVAREHSDEIARECLGTAVRIGEHTAESREHGIGEERLFLAVRKVPA